MNCCYVVVVKKEDGQSVRTRLDEAGAFDNERKIRANAADSLEIPVAGKTKEELTEILQGVASWEITSTSFETKKVRLPSQAEQIAACVEKVKVQLFLAILQFFLKA